MRVLIGCEFSGKVRDAFRRRGHNAWSCDLLPTTAPGPHIQGDVLQALAQGWDLGIFHPPCTFLTCSAEWAYKDGPYHQRLKPGTLTGAARRAARVDAIEFTKRLLGAAVQRIALENPVGALSSAVRKPDQIVQPYQFGHDASKATCLWLKGLPPLKPTTYVAPRLVCGRCGAKGTDKGCSECGADCGAMRPRWSNQTDSGHNRLSPAADRWAERSVTFPGIAEAMAEQWG